MDHEEEGKNKLAIVSVNNHYAVLVLEQPINSERLHIMKIERIPVVFVEYSLGVFIIRVAT
jgi:hypothetical protein